jgi:hypothetical protein
LKEKWWPQRDASKLTEFKWAISLPADSGPEAPIIIHAAPGPQRLESDLNTLAGAQTRDLLTPNPLRSQHSRIERLQPSELTSLPYDGAVRMVCGGRPRLAPAWNQICPTPRADTSRDAWRITVNRPGALDRPVAPLATCGSNRPRPHPAAVTPSVGLVTPM